MLPKVHNAQELTALVEELGFLPLFRCGVPGFSLQEATPSEYWFQEGVDGPWEWREQLAAQGRVIYAKLFEKKAGFVSQTWYPYFVNVRREGCDFDLAYQEGRVTLAEKRIFDALSANGPSLSSDLKRIAGEKGFETALCNLQMRTYAVVRGFEYKRDLWGRPYGWGVGRYALAGQIFGEDMLLSACDEAPEQSRQRLIERVRALFPDAPARAVARLIG